MRVKFARGVRLGFAFFYSWSCLQSHCLVLYLSGGLFGPVLAARKPPSQMETPMRNIPLQPTALSSNVRQASSDETLADATGFAHKRCTGVPDISLTEGKTARAGGYHRYRGWRQRARPIARGGKIEHPFL